LESEIWNLNWPPANLWSPQEDVGSLTQEFKKSYIDEKSTAPKEEEKNTPEWDKLMRSLFVRQK
jgi:hypothetical protein